VPPPPQPSRSRQLSAVPSPTRRPVPAPFSDEPTRQVDDELLSALRNAAPAKAAPRPGLPKPSTILAAPTDPTIDVFVDGDSEEMTLPADDLHARFLSQAPMTDPDLHLDEQPEEATRLSRIDGIAAMERARHGPPNDERTRAVNIRNDPSISDIDWDLD
jgi:hypothetical protein